MEDPNSKPGRGDGTVGAGGLRTPVKGESSSGNLPYKADSPTPSFDPDATLIDPGVIDPDATHFDPEATLIDADATLADGVPSRSSATIRRSVRLRGDVKLQVGEVIGERYEILAVLGEGGMGAVYKANDLEVDRFVALKLIRPDLASNPTILARFKQELLTAHQVTHKNVIRIYDLAEADGVKFITMEFVDGGDLRRLLLDHGKLLPEEAVGIFRQVCLALDAAHSVGVLHRDLKPQNIMRDQNGRVLVMDFGLARSTESDGMTQSGALMGTLEYMSPEQAMGKRLDQRSDIFSLGLIFCELLTGAIPYKADTAMASLLQRNQERATPAVEMDPSVPKGLSDIVGKCLERDLNLRYQSAQEVLNDLDAWSGSRPLLASAPSAAQATKRKLPGKWIGIAALAIVIALAIVGWLFRGKIMPGTGGKAAAGPHVSLAILPFHNATADPSLDWIGSSLAEMLSTDVGQSAHMRVVSSDRLHQILEDLHVPANADLDPDTLQRIAGLSNADTVVWGNYAKFGSQIRIDATLLNLKSNQRSPMEIEAASEKDIPATVDGLAALIRKNLSVSSNVLKELKASSFQPTSTSVAALRDYNQSGELLDDGKNLEAVTALQSAIAADPKFALAYSRLAETESALGYDTDAQGYSQKAVDLSQNLPLAEKYLIAANHARVMKDNPKAIEAYENLSKTFPGNEDVEYELGSLYKDKGDYDGAKAQFSKILRADPKNIKALWQMGVLEIMKDNPQAALEPLNQGLSLAIQVDNQEQRALLLQAIGICYRLMNKPEEALRNYQDSIVINRRLGLKRNLANNLSELAQVQNTLGKPAVALASYTEALKLLQDIGMKKEYGDVLINRGVLYESQGDYDHALQDYQQSLQIQRDAGDEDYQSLCLNNIGEVYLEKGDTDNALIYLQQSLQLRQKQKTPQPQYVAETLNAIGGVYRATGQYDKALSSFMHALEISRKANDAEGAAVESNEIGMVLQNQGQLGAAVSAMQDAVNGYQAAGNRGLEMAEALNDFADTLVLAGRGSEAAKPLQDAQGIASGLKNHALSSKLLSTQGDMHFYSGDMGAARTAYEQALRAGSQGNEKAQVLRTKLSLAEMDIAQGHATAAIAGLRTIIQQADSQNLKYFSLRGSVALAAAMIGNKDYAHARQQLDSALDRSVKLGLRVQTVKVHYLLGNLRRLTGENGEAVSEYTQVIQLLDGMKKEPGAEHILDRFDLHTMYAEATRWSGNGAKN